MSAFDYKSLIKDVPDFPKKGVMFRDISPLLANAQAFKQAMNDLAFQLKMSEVDAFAGIESRGFILAAALAAFTGKGFLPLRKAGKLPPPTLRESYSLEYGEAILEISPGQNRIVIVDDVLATGGTLQAAISLCEKAGHSVKDVVVLIDLRFLNDFQFRGSRVKSLVQYE